MTRTETIIANGGQPIPPGGRDARGRFAPKPIRLGNHELCPKCRWYVADVSNCLVCREKAIDEAVKATLARVYYAYPWEELMASLKEWVGRIDPSAWISPGFVHAVRETWFGEHA